MAISAPTAAQPQLWEEYIFNYKLSERYSLEYSATYSTILDPSNWWSFDNTITLERTFGAHFSVSPYLDASYTRQTDSYNTFEVRPSLGVRYHITPNKRLLSRIYLRYENRHIQDLESNEWNTSNRLRVRPELIIPLSKKSYQEDHLWYGILDAEWFINFDEDQKERFANRFRLRTGIGYRLTYLLRFEVIGVIQASKETLDEHFQQTDGVLRIRLKHYVRKNTQN